MIRNSTPLLLLSVLVVLSMTSCATDRSAPASPEDVAKRLILEADAGIDNVCTDRRFGSTERMPAPKIKGVYESVDQERRNLIRCGKTVPYIVIFAHEYAFSGGRTEVRVRPEHESIPEMTYVKNVAIRNHCEPIGKPRKVVKPGSTHRHYEVPCKDRILYLECGPIEKGSSRETCWKM